MNEMFKIARETTTATTENETKDGIERGPHTECSPLHFHLIISDLNPCYLYLVDVLIQKVWNSKKLHQNFTRNRSVRTRISKKRNPISYQKPLLREFALAHVYWWQARISFKTDEFP